MVITLKGNPVSVNALYYGRRFLSNRGRELKKDYFYQLKGQYHNKPTAKRLKLTIFAYFGSKRIRDLDNIGKVVLDALNGIVFEDDGQIDELHIFRRYDKNNPRMEVETIELSTDGACKVV